MSQDTNNPELQSQHNDDLQKDPNAKAKKIYMLIGCVIFIVAVTAFGHYIASLFSGSATTEDKPKPTKVSATDSSALANNYNQLLKGYNQAPKQKSQTVINKLFNGNTEDNSAEVAAQKSRTQRMGASALIYGGSQQRGANNVSSANKTPKAGASDSYSQFADSQPTSVDTVSAQVVAHPSWTIVQGSFIRGTLETQINTDLPGQIRMVVSEPVYGYTGDRVLIPAGSRVVGSYASSSSFGGQGKATTRTFVIWNRIITPDGVSVMIHSPGTDTLGTAGVGADEINTHWFASFGQAILLSIINAGVQTAGVGTMDQPNSADQYRAGVGQAIQQQASQKLKQGGQIKPTLITYPGKRMNIFVAHDLSLYSVRYKL